MNQNQKVSSILTIAGLFAILPFVQGNAFAATPDFGMLYYDGEVVSTIIPPSETRRGLDDLYLVKDQQGPIQMPIAAVAPGDRDYHGGQWVVSEVTFNVEPYELKSEAEVLAAEALGDVTVVKTENYFLCPIQP